ncbi:unnamed protein product, partial [Ascophyllum nodosum]
MLHCSAQRFSHVFYALMYVHNVQQDGHQPCMVANPACGQLKRKITFPCPRSRLRIWPRETGPAVLSHLYSTARPNLARLATIISIRYLVELPIALNHDRSLAASFDKCLSCNRATRGDKEQFNDRGGGMGEKYPLLHWECD